MEAWAGAHHRVVMIVLNDVAHDNRVLKTARFIQSTGAEVTVFGVSRDREVIKPSLARLSGIRTRIFPNPRFSRQNCPSQKINYIANQFSLTSSFLAFAAKINPTVIYTHDYNTLRIGAEMTSWLRRGGANLAWVHDLHEYVVGLTTIDEDVRRLASREEQEFIQAPDHLVTVSPPLAAALQRDYGLHRRPSVVLNSNSMRSMKLRRDRNLRDELALPAPTPLAVYTGNVAAPRGVHTLVAAMAHVPDLHVAIITNNASPYVDSVKATAVEGGFAERLHWLPYVPPEEVPAYIRGVSLGVHPMVHFENAEVALPNKLFDYCLAQVPCVVSDCRAMGDFVKRWNIGEVFPAENVMALARAIKRVLARRPVYVRSLKADGGLLRRFSWERQCDVLSTVLASATRVLDAQELGEQDVLPLDAATTASVAPPSSTASGSSTPSQPVSGQAVAAPPVANPSNLIGAVTGVAADNLLGWVIDRCGGQVMPRVELFHEDVRVATGLLHERTSTRKDGSERGGWRFAIPLPSRFADAQPHRLVVKVESGERALEGSQGILILGEEPSWTPEIEEAGGTRSAFGTPLGDAKDPIVG